MAEMVRRIVISVMADKQINNKLKNVQSPFVEGKCSTEWYQMSVGAQSLSEMLGRGTSYRLLCAKSFLDLNNRKRDMSIMARNKKET
jgi:hypothetical protein